MKKLFMVVLGALLLVSVGTAHAQTPADLNAQYQATLIQLIEALKQQVVTLQAQLAALEAAQLQAPQALDTGAGAGTPTVSEPIANQTPSSPAPIAIEPVAPVLKTISVSITNGLVVVKNDVGVPVRVVNLDVPGAVVSGFSFSTGPISYAPSFKDSTGKTFDAFACSGAGSEGMAQLPQQGPVDPCLRKNSNLLRNEIQPGETMTLRYSGEPTQIVYQAGSIVEVGTGNDVQF